MANIVLAATWAKNAIMRILLESVMAAEIDSVIVQDPEIHSGARSSEVLVFLSKLSLTASKVEKLWMNF
jgi:hypothetical protein